MWACTQRGHLSWSFLSSAGWLAPKPCTLKHIVCCTRGCCTAAAAAAVLCALTRDHDVEGMTDGFDAATAYGQIEGYEDPSMGWSR